MGNNILKYVFIIIVIGLIGFGMYTMLKNEETHSDEVLDQTSTINTIQTDLRLAICEFDSINPLLTNNRNVQEVSKVIFEPLITLTNEYKLKYCLAEEIAKIDDLNYVIKLRKGVLWHDGNQFNSNDVKFTIDTIKQGGINTVYANNLKAVVGLEPIDDYTVKLTLGYPVDFFEYNLTFPILSANYYANENFSNTEKNNKPVGTGLFKITNIDSNVIQLEKNDSYWDTSRKTTSNKISINLYNSAGEMYNAFKNGEIDLIDVKIPNVEEYIGSIGYKKVEYKSRNYTFLALNTENEVLSDTAVRKAISKIIDKNNIVATCLGTGYVASNFNLDMGNWLYTKDLTVQVNSDEAKSILFQNGWEYKNNKWRKVVDNKTIELAFSIAVNGNDSTRVAVAENIKEQLSNFGINVYVKQLNNESYSSSLSNSDFDIIVTGIQCGFSPSLNTFFGESNISKYSNNEISEILNVIKNSSDENTLHEKYNRLYDIYLDEAPYIGLYRDTDVVIYNQGLVGNIKPNAFNLYYNIEKWYRQ